MISRLLVANRGEITRRVFATCRAAGIGTVAVYADPDAVSPHVAEADLAVRLPGTGAAATYLNGPALVAAALAAGADAVHPGYGFLAEDPGFARQVQAAGLTWVGPPPVAMEAMSLKTVARKVAADAGLPVLPELDPESVTEFPVLVKAAAGGGGRGMRAVRDRAGLAGALASAGREALAAFGDGTVFCEPLLTGARHIEVQVLADQAGTIWALTERDCSVQRRYQKVIEESPSPAVSPRLRERLLGAAAALAAAVGYQSAGTVEFLVSGEDFYFLEFNTRLQVEHPVTEFVHGIDLVALQLGIAEGLPLPAAAPPASGHAIQARVYAEDPAAGFRPAAGPLYRFEFPAADRWFGNDPVPGGPVLRLDAGTGSGQVISPHYDPMLAKLIAWAPGAGAAARRAAIRRLAAGLAGARIAGPATNRDLLMRILRDPVFLAGQADTSLLAGYDLTTLLPDRQAIALSALAAAFAAAAAHRDAASGPARRLGGFRNVRSAPHQASFSSPLGQVEVAYEWERSGPRPSSVTVAGQPWPDPRPGPAAGTETAGIQVAGIQVAGIQVAEFSRELVVLDIGDVRHRFSVIMTGDGTWVDSVSGSVRLTMLERLPEPARAAEPGSLIAPMPGIVTQLGAAAGDKVVAGQVIVVLEAMKMEHQVTAPATGLLADLRVAGGNQVGAGEVLAIVVPAEPDLEGPDPGRPGASAAGARPAGAAAGARPAGAAAGVDEEEDP